LGGKEECRREPGKAPREKPEGGHGRQKGVTEAGVGDKVQESLAKEGWTKVEVEDLESRVDGPRFSTRRHKMTRSSLVAVPFESKLGWRPSTLSRPDYAKRNGNHIVPPWILAPLLLPQSRKVR